MSTGLNVEPTSTLLNLPQWFGLPEVKILPGLPEHYQIEQVLPDWFVVKDSAGDCVYSGIGPVSIERAPVPF
ncbi:Uncharacterised protein [Delftia tsuruhatensis]|nr:Uncharacterised protein [Delftia tsuruhatensis]CAC9683229.1 Uncharacterised protein [Delftia tsuruhatensis]